MTTQELVERLRRTADLPDTSRIDPLLAKVMTAIAELMAASADRLSEMEAALRAQEWQDIETGGPSASQD